jgi:hypothetical protein
MTASRRLIVTAATVLALAGCTPQPAPPMPAPANPSAWDGTYRGTIRLTQLGPGLQKDWCETEPKMEVIVADGGFSYAVSHPNAPGNPTSVYVGVVRPDGSVSAQLVSGVMTGNVTGTQMTGTISGAGCIYAFALNRS